MLYTFHQTHWNELFHTDEQNRATQLLEEGHVLHFPNLSFQINENERFVLTPQCLKGRSKNISYNAKTRQVKGASENSVSALNQLMDRFQTQSLQFINSLIPHYQPSLEVGRTSYRPIEVVGRKRSLRQDDTRIHVDAFSATPLQGKRILRVFSNINPNGKDRIWNIGEPFEHIVEKFKTQFTRPFPGLRKALFLLGFTKSYRTLYDHLMLQLHNSMKESDSYQNTCRKITAHLPPHSTWVVMTDKVSHAALSGQYMLEQTFYLPWDKMKDPEQSPLRILQRMLGFSAFNTLDFIKN